MTYTIRAERPEDQDWILAALLGLQAHEHAIHDTRLPAEPRSTALYLEHLRARIMDHHGMVLIAEDGNTAVGLIAGYVVDEPWPVETLDSTRYAYISDLFIRPEHRGTGLAEQLFQAIARHFRAVPLPLKRLRVNVLAVNAIACAAYEKAGFRPYEVMYEQPL